MPGLLISWVTIDKPDKSLTNKIIRFKRVGGEGLAIKVIGLGPDPGALAKHLQNAPEGAGMSVFESFYSVTSNSSLTPSVLKGFHRYWL